MKKKYPDMPNGKGIPMTGIANARPETKRIKELVLKQMKFLPINLEDYINYDDPDVKMSGDWGH